MVSAYWTFSKCGVTLQLNLHNTSSAPAEHHKTPKNWKVLSRDPPEQSSQQLGTLAEFLPLLGNAGSAIASVGPIEGRNTVDEEESQAWPWGQGGLQEVEGEEELGGGGAVYNKEAWKTGPKHRLVWSTWRRAGRVTFRHGERQWCDLDLHEASKQLCNTDKVRCVCTCVQSTV